MTKANAVINCKLCGKEFLAPDKGYRYCSKERRTKINTSRHRRYVSKNREHLREYLRNWKHADWGESNDEIAKQAEKLASEKILPKLGFYDIFDVKAVRRFVPFDFVATLKGERGLIDVTTGLSKGGAYHRTAVSLAKALRMRLLTLFVKPDLRAYYMRDSTKTFHMSIRELVPIG